MATIHRFSKSKKETNAQQPTFSQDFLAEVRACPDTEAFRNVLAHRGLWINQNAAEGVFFYLKQLDNQALSDDSLGSITGGVRQSGADELLIESMLKELSNQLTQRS